MTNFDHKSDMAKNEPTAPVCPHCSVAMKHVRTLPRLGGLLEIQVFYCASCVHAETITLKRAA
jgi:C4-type Zn-finger protein